MLTLALSKLRKLFLLNITLTFFLKNKSVLFSHKFLGNHKDNRSTKTVSFALFVESGCF